MQCFKGGKAELGPPGRLGDAFKTLQEWFKYYVRYLYIFLFGTENNWSSVLKDNCLRSAWLTMLVFLLISIDSLESW